MMQQRYTPKSGACYEKKQKTNFAAVSYKGVN
jgi:hypothetical protein